MPNFGTYQGHTILSNAMDTALQNEMNRKANEIEAKKANTEHELAQIDLDKYKKQIAREKVKSDFIKSAYAAREGIGSLYDDSGNMNPNAGNLLNAYNNTFDKSALIEYDKEGILTADDYVNMDKHLGHLAIDDMAQIRERFANMSDSEQDDFLANPGINEAINIHRVRTGTDDGMISNKDFINKESSTDGVLGDVARGWGTDDPNGVLLASNEGGGNTYFKGHTSPTSQDKRQYTILSRALQNMKTKDDVWLTQEGDTWQIEVDDFWLTGNDKYEVRWDGNTPTINFNEEGWVPLSDLETVDD
tara:strand:- start:3496 stop:4407 length:912 start_codon:yes stop_codon:yes gene_type:complete